MKNWSDVIQVALILNNIIINIHEYLMRLISYIFSSEVTDLNHLYFVIQSQYNVTVTPPPRNTVDFSSGTHRINTIT